MQSKLTIIANSFDSKFRISFKLIGSYLVKNLVNHFPR